MKNSIYQCEESYIQCEQHAGVTIELLVWDYLFIYSNGDIAMVTAGNDVLQLFFNYNSLRLKGDMKMTNENMVKITLKDKNVTRYLVADFKNNYQSINISEFDDKSVRVKDYMSFRKLNLDFDEIGKKFGQIDVFTPLYSKPLIKSRLNVVQGSKVEVVEILDDWINVIIDSDPNYKGWVPKDSVRMWKL